MMGEPCLLRKVPVVPSCPKEYYDFVDLLETIDSLLEKTRAKKKLVDLDLKKVILKIKMDTSQISRFRAIAKFEIRCNLLRRLQDMDYRVFSVQASDSIIVQWFLRRGQIEEFTEEITGKGLSKSSLERYDKLIPVEDIENVVRYVCASVSKTEWAGKMPGWNAPLSVKDIFVDCTCLESNIHFPVDWVLFRDAVCTLSLAIECIRLHGLKHRIKDPALFIRVIH